MKDRVKALLILIGVIVASYIIFKILQPARFGGLSSIWMIVQQSFLPSVAACGYFFAYTIGQFDLSMGANIIISALVGCLCANSFGYVGLVLGCIVTGTLVGLFNGIVSLKLRIPAIIATVGLLIVYECLGYYLTIVAGGTNSLTLDISLRAFGTAPWNVILSVLSFAVTYVIYRYSRLGLYANAIGTDNRLAQHAGIDVDKYILYASIVGGIFLGITSILTISYGSTLSPALNMESFKRGFKPIMGCFLGISMKKYINPMIAIILGEFLLTMLINGLMTNGVDATIQDVVSGIVLLGMVCMTMRSDKYAEVK